MSWREVYTADLTGQSSVSPSTDALFDVVREYVVSNATQSALETANNCILLPAILQPEC